MDGGEKENVMTYNLASASGTCLGVFHRKTAVAVATVDLTKLSSLNGKLGIKQFGKWDH